MNKMEELKKHLLQIQDKNNKKTTVGYSEPNWLDIKEIKPRIWVSKETIKLNNNQLKKKK